MHYCVYVFIPKEGAIDEQVAWALQPYDEDLDVPPYKVYLDAGEIAAMAKHYRVEKTDLTALAAHMQDWQRGPGDIDENGLFAIKSYNPSGKWDWYEIGGRWAGRPHGDLTTANALHGRPKQKSLLPAAMLTPDCAWHECETFITEGWMRWRVDRKTDADWLREVRDALRRYPDHRVVCVDIHR